MRSVCTRVRLHKLGIRHPLAEAGAAQDRAVALDGLAVVLDRRREGAPLGVGEGGAHLRMQRGLVRLTVST